MLAEIGIDFELQYPPHFKQGSFFQKRNIEQTLTDEELKKIPEKFRPIGPIIRSWYSRLDIPLFNKVTNRVEVIFNSEEPKI
jgi:hypothetical protein